jgi:hypothetical protein
MLVTTWVTRSRTVRLLAVAGAAAAVFALSSPPSHVAYSANRVAVCSHDVVAGVEVDNCVPNPNANVNTYAPGDYPELVPEFKFGVGF